MVRFGVGKTYTDALGRDVTVTERKNGSITFAIHGEDEDTCGMCDIDTFVNVEYVHNTLCDLLMTAAI